MTSKGKENEALRKALLEGIRSTEQQRAIDEAGSAYYYSSHQKFDDKLKKWVIEEALSHLRPGRVLDLGYINDIWPQALLSRTDITGIDIVEAAASHVEQARKDLQSVDRVRIFHSLFEEFEPDVSY